MRKKGQKDISISQLSPKVLKELKCLEGKNKQLFLIKEDSITLSSTEKKLESDIQAEILKYLKLRYVYFWRQNNAGIRGRRFTGLRGVHDILGFYKPKFFPIPLFTSIEVKLPKKKMSDSQINFKNMVTKNGHISFMACSVKDVIHALEEIDKENWNDWLSNIK